MTVGFVRSGKTSTGNFVAVRSPSTMQTSAAPRTIVRLARAQ